MRSPAPNPSATPGVPVTDGHARMGDDRQRLVLDHLPLAERLAKRYTPGRLDDDTHQAALLGLTLAARRFDPERGVPFGAYAVPTVMGEVRKHYRHVGWPVRPPRRLQELSQRLRREERRLQQELGRAPDLHELALAADTDVTSVRDALQARLPARSVDEEVTATVQVGDAGDDVVRGLVAAEALRALDTQDRELLSLRYGHELTQREIAGRLHMSQPMVHRRLRSIVAQLQLVVAD